MSRFPLWAKLIVALTLLSGFGLTTLYTVGVYNLVEKARECTEPKFIETIIAKFGTFNGLPNGLTYQFAVAFGGSNVVMFQKPNDQMAITLGLIPQLSKLDEDTEKSEKNSPSKRVLEEDPKKLLAFIIERGFVGLPQDADLTKLESEQFGGRTFNYLTCTAAGDKDKTLQSLLGCIILKEKEKFILVYAVSPDSQANKSMVRELLGSFASF